MALREWVDSHGHLFGIDESPRVVLDRAAAKGVKWLLCPGVDAVSSRRSQEIASEHPDRVLWSAGLHPHDASRWPDEEEAIVDLAREADAVGECGLDFYRNLAPRDHQVDAFRAHLVLAKDLGKPIVIHCRDAFADVYEMVGAADLGERAVLHCWTGGRKWTKRFRDLGVMFSFAGPLTYATGETLRLAASEVPMDRALVETDAPYLTPEPIRSQRNEPANVGLTGAALAEVWGVEVDDAARATTDNAVRVFGGPRG